MNDELAERFTNLESKIAQLEYLAERLNEVVTDQARELHQLKRKVDGQAESLQTIELERIRAANPRPPHYE